MPVVPGSNKRGPRMNGGEGANCEGAGASSVKHKAWERLGHVREVLLPAEERD